MYCVSVVGAGEACIDPAYWPYVVAVLAVVATLVGQRVMSAVKRMVASGSKCALVYAWYLRLVYGVQAYPYAWYTRGDSPDTHSCDVSSRVYDDYVNDYLLRENFIEPEKPSWVRGTLFAISLWSGFAYVVVSRLMF